MVQSCYTCRHRHVECDKLHVPCRKCQKAGVECLQKRPWRWVNGPNFRRKAESSTATAARGALYQGPESDKSQDKLWTRPKTALPVPRDERTPATTISNRRSVVYQRQGLDPQFLNMSLCLSDPSLANLDSTSRFYLNHYSRCVCKLFIMFDSPQNPLRQLIPVALADPLLLASVIALAARHHENAKQISDKKGTLEDSALPVSRQRAILYKYKAIHDLALALDNQMRHSTDVIVTSAFLLIFLDLLESGNDKWHLHLKGVKALFSVPLPKTSSNGLTPTIGGLRDFVAGQIYLIETLGATFAQSGTRSEILKSDQLPASFPRTMGMAYLGCPDYLLSTIRCFSAARDCLEVSKSLGNIDTLTLLERISGLLEHTAKFDPHAWVAGQLQARLAHFPSDQKTDDMLGSLAQSYKAATTIYGWRICDALTTDTTPLGDVVDGLVNAIGALRQDRTLFKCILWPLFIAGLECQCGQQRDYIRQCLQRFRIETKCVNVVNAVAILDRLWAEAEHHSRNWIFSFGAIEGDWLM
ncbi:fungal-specific transcription factor domain-containing protein, partial [Aspergillus unguis]